MDHPARRALSRSRAFGNFRPVLAAVALLLLPGLVFAPPAISLKVTGKWSLILRATDLIGGAGTDYTSPFESATNEVSLTISKTAGITAPWRMDIRRGDVNWNPALTLYVRRTSDGTGDGTISGGLTYQIIDTIDLELFSGTGDRSQIDLQYKIEGFSVDNLNVDTFQTTIYYTVTEL